MDFHELTLQRDGMISSRRRRSGTSMRRQVPRRLFIDHLKDFLVRHGREIAAGSGIYTLLLGIKANYSVHWQQVNSLAAFATVLIYDYPVAVALFLHDMESGSDGSVLRTIRGMLENSCELRGHNPWPALESISERPAVVIIPLEHAKAIGDWRFVKPDCACFALAHFEYARSIVKRTETYWNNFGIPARGRFAMHVHN